MFDPPGPRLREHVLALRAIFRAFRGDAPLDFAGEYFRFSLLPTMWSRADRGPYPPIDVAAVNPWMLRMAGEVADGVHVHPLNTTTYVRETLLPNLAEGARRGRRDRTLIAFYGSTPNYAFIFRTARVPRHDRTPTRGAEARRHGGHVSAVIGDELLSHFVVEGSWGDKRETFERFGALARQIVADATSWT